MQPFWALLIEHCPWQAGLPKHALAFWVWVWHASLTEWGKEVISPWFGRAPRIWRMTPSSFNPFASPSGDADPAKFVEADCFRGTTLTGFVDRFRISGPSERDLARRIVFFYRQAKAKVVSDQFPLRFTRGNLMGSLLGPEKWALQEIAIHRKDQPKKK